MSNTKKLKKRSSFDPDALSPQAEKTLKYFVYFIVAIVLILGAIVVFQKVKAKGITPQSNIGFYQGGNNGKANRNRILAVG